MNKYTEVFSNTFYINKTPIRLKATPSNTVTGAAPEGAYWVLIEGKAVDGRDMRHAFTATLLR